MERGEANDSSLTDSSRLAVLGLVPDLVIAHQRRIRAALTADSAPFATVVDTLRRDNGGILAPDWGTELRPIPPHGFLAFVPAAGAASRYFEPLADIQTALMAGDPIATARCAHKLAQAGATQWALPTLLGPLIRDSALAETLSPFELIKIAMSLEQPKALHPCTQDGLTFLAMKHLEHKALSGVDGEVFVVPPGTDPQGSDDDFLTEYWHQGPALSTLRFDAHGEPFVDGDGTLSVVPAGHGALAQLFPKIKARYPSVHSLFIRNIDNVMGLGRAAIDASARFLSIHMTILNTVTAIRAALQSEDWARAAIVIQPLLALRGTPPIDETGTMFLGSSRLEFRPLWELQLRLFGTDPVSLGARRAQLGDQALLTLLYERPVNTLGQVPNSGNDVGGTPVSVQTRKGRQRLCIESVHARPEDRAALLDNPLRATHFNPVFVAAELPLHDHAYADDDGNFWILATKSFKGRRVYYHETALYELLGNSLLANATFVEVPRIVFNPHKSLADNVSCVATAWTKG